MIDRWRKLALALFILSIIAFYVGITMYLRAPLYP
jgi:hypothetical protein